MRFIWLLILCTTLRGGDCVPLTFDTMSGFAGQKISCETWTRDLSDNVEWNNAIKVWNNHMMLMQIRCIYSKNPAQIIKDEIMNYDEPHFWIGTVPKEMQANPLSLDNCHCAIAYLTRGGFVLVHTLEPGKFYVEPLTEEQFIKRTYMVYKVGGLGVGRVSIPKSVMP